MEKHPIELWDRLVCVNLYPSKLEESLSDKGSAELLIEESKRASKEVRSYLARESALCRSREEMALLIERYQSFFSQLSEVLYRYQPGTNFPVAKAVYERVANDLEAILLFLETSFPAYFNLSGKVPGIMRARYERSMRPQLSEIKKEILEREKNQDLVERIFNIIESYLQPEGAEPLSFHLLNYFKSLLKFLARWNPEIFEDSKLPPIVELLISLKFNDARFLDIVFGIIKQNLSAVESEDQYKLLKGYYKNTSQLLDRSSEPLCLNKPSPKDLILDWLSQEIYFLETCYPKKENTPDTVPAKIKTSLSVPVLALYIRLFKESGIITNNNYQELFRAVSSAFTTNRNAEAAHSHLHSKFYAIEESARRKVFDQLMEMAHLCKRIG
jgi:hypothetical protein